MIIDLGSVSTVQELHLKFKTELGFPDFYGMNWDAFRDAINDLAEMPEEVSIINFEHIEEALPSDAEILRELIMDFNRLDGNCQIGIEKQYWK